MTRRTDHHVSIGTGLTQSALPTKNGQYSAKMIGPLRLCCIRVLVIEQFLLNFFFKKKTFTVLYEQDRPPYRRRPQCGPCNLVSCRKDWPSSPKKMCLELAEALQEVRERWSFSESGENCAQETFQGHLDSERLKLTAICTAAIATLPRTSFPDDNFASCLLHPVTSCKAQVCLRLGGSEQKKKGGRNADSLRTARSASVQQYKWRSNLPRIWPHLRVLVASAWRKLIDGHSQVANPVFFSLGVCENNSSIFFLSLAKLCRLKFTFTEQEK